MRGKENSITSDPPGARRVLRIAVRNGLVRPRTFGLQSEQGIGFETTREVEGCASWRCWKPSLEGLPKRRGQGPRRLRPGRRPPPDRRHRPDQRVRLGPARRHPRQGARADRPERASGSAGSDRRRNHLISTDIDDAGLDLAARRPRGADGPVDGRPEGRRRPVRVRRPGLSLGQRLEGVPASRARSAAQPLPPGLVESDRTRRAPLHARDQGRDRPRRERPVRPDGRGDRRRFRPSSSPRRASRFTSPAAELRRVEGPDPGRHQVRVGPRPRDGRADARSTRSSPPTARATGRRTSYRPGGPQPSFDKQFVRDWLEATGWDKASPPPPLPDDVVARTREKYVEAYEILTGQPFPWK